MEGMLATGRVQRPHGVKGYLRVESFSGETKHILKLKGVVLEHQGNSEHFAIESSKKNGKNVLLKLEGIESPEAAKRFSNWTVWVTRKKAAARRRNEFYTADLPGCAVLYGNESVGRVEAVCDTSLETFLEIRTDDGEKHLLPFTKRHFGKINLKKRRVVLRENWLLE
jgi:16S rRNA processing protein RimM